MKTFTCPSTENGYITVRSLMIHNLKSPRAKSSTTMQIKLHFTILSKKRPDSKESIRNDSIHKIQKQLKQGILFRDVLLSNKTVNKIT